MKRKKRAPLDELEAARIVARFGSSEKTRQDARRLLLSTARQIPARETTIDDRPTLKFCLLLFVGALFTLVPTFVFAKLWLWFVTPLGVPPITFAQAYGFMCVFSLLRVCGRDTKEADPVPAFRWVVKMQTTKAIFAFYLLGLGAFVRFVVGL